MAAAAEVATLSDLVQQEIVARGPVEILAAAKRIRGARQAVKRAKRIAKIAAIARGNEDLPQDRKWPVLYADPPWKFKTYSDVTGMDRAADNHYPTMTVEEIRAMPVGDIATPDAVLFLWATAPMMPEALEVMRAWGFKYQSQMVWDKVAVITGYWFRNQHELLLVGTRGDIPAPPMGTQSVSVLRIKSADHSEKPEEFRRIIDRYYPELPRIELFARLVDDKGKPLPRPKGWHAWGNQAKARAA